LQAEHSAVVKVGEALHGLLAGSVSASQLFEEDDVLSRIYSSSKAL
jgi:hypothetical protein